MYIVTKYSIINSDRIASFNVISKAQFLGESYDPALDCYRGMTGYKLVAYPNGYNGYFILGSYDTEEDAQKDLKLIFDALLNGAKALDLS